MNYRFFKIPVEGGPVEEEMNQFMGACQVVAVERQFVQDGRDSFWALCVRYHERGAGSPLVRKGKVDYREILGAEDFAMYDALRNLRKELSERDGVPPYALFTNDQLAAMVQQGVKSREDMARIDGVGPARIEKYADSFLQVLGAKPRPPERGAGK